MSSAPAVPQTMRAMRCVGEKQLRQEVIPVPQPGPKEVLVKVAASAVNPVDYKVYGGFRALAKPYPFTLGCDLAGTVAAVGGEVKDFKVGDEVFGMTGSLGHAPEGTLAEYAIAWEAMLAKKPKNLSMRQAAAVPLGLMTAYEGMVDRNKIKPTDYVLITGASGAIGQICLQLARHAGAAKVFGLASEAKRDLVEQYGATFVDYKQGTEALERVKQEQTPDGRGFDVVYETVGGGMLDVVIGLLAPHGFIAEINGFEPHQLATAAMKGAMISFPLTCLPFMHPEPRNAVYMGGLLRAALPLLESEEVVVLVDEEHKFPFTAEGVVQAYDTLEHCRNRGKLVFDVTAP